MVLRMQAVPLPIRTGCPDKPPSPEKSPGPSTATTASFPVFESTEIFTAPFWMYRTLAHGSPWVKMTSARRYSTILLATPVESRKAWTSNAPSCFDSVGRPLRKSGSADDRLDGRLTLAATRTRAGVVRERFKL